MGQGPLAGGEKKAIVEHYTLVWVDESGFYLLPAVQRTYAPVKTPIIRSPLTNDHFLQHLLHHIPGKLLILWDGSPTHRSKKSRAFLASGATTRIHLERLPSYAPELNPDQGIWRYLKRVELKNLACHDLCHLRAELRKATQRLRRKTNIIKGCIRQPGYI